VEKPNNGDVEISLIPSKFPPTRPGEIIDIEWNSRNGFSF